MHQLWMIWADGNGHICANGPERTYGAEGDSVPNGKVDAFASKGGVDEVYSEAHHDPSTTAAFLRTENSSKTGRISCVFAENVGEQPAMTNESETMEVGSKAA
jgi:hypothetical protein